MSPLPDTLLAYIEGLASRSEQFLEEGRSESAIAEWEEAEGLTCIGSGATRLVYSFPASLNAEHLVLKLCYTDATSANLNEARAWQRMQSKPDVSALLVPVLASCPKGRWLVMPRVQLLQRPFPPFEHIEVLRQAGFDDVDRPDNWSSDERLLDYGEWWP